MGKRSEQKLPKEYILIAKKHMKEAQHHWSRRKCKLKLQ